MVIRGFYNDFRVVTGSLPNITTAGQPVASNATLPSACNNLLFNIFTQTSDNDTFISKTGTGILGTVTLTPKTYHRLLETDRAISKMGTGARESVPHVPDSVAVVPERVTDVPNCVQHVPERVRHVPEHVSVVPECVRYVPEHVPIVPERVRHVPEHVSVVPECVRYVPEHVSIVPECVRYVPEHVSVVPECVQHVPEHVRVVPERVQHVPEHVLVVSAYDWVDTGYLPLIAMDQIDNSNTLSIFKGNVIVVLSPLSFNRRVGGEDLRPCYFLHHSSFLGKGLYQSLKILFFINISCKPIKMFDYE